jgi:hypothetical protein
MVTTFSHHHSHRFDVKSTLEMTTHKAPEANLGLESSAGWISPSRVTASIAAPPLSERTAIEMVTTDFGKYLLVPPKVLTDRGIEHKDFMAHLAKLSLGSFALSQDPPLSPEVQSENVPTGLLFIDTSKASEAATSYLNTITRDTPAPSLDAPWTVTSETPHKAEYPIPVATLDFEKDQSRRIEGRLCVPPTTEVARGDESMNASFIKFRYLDYSFIPAAYEGFTTLRPIDSVDSVRCYLTEGMAKGILRRVNKRYTADDGLDKLSTFLRMSGL